MTRMSRRAFLRSSVAIGAGAMLLRYSDGSYQIVTEAAGPAVYNLRIIHTNDHHARIEPTPDITIRAASGSNPAVTRSFGGVARRKTIFDQIRADSTVQDKLFLDAGDIFQGTLYFNQFNGLADREFYNALDYDAVAVGNHEFDKGDATLADFISGTTFPMLAANVGAVAPSPLAPLIVTTDTTPDAKLGSRTIITSASGKKIGIFGLTTPEAKELSSPSAQVTIDQNLVAVAQAQIAALKAASCDVIIALTHIGYTLDLDLARQTTGINVIVGGHSHTPLLPDAQTALPLGVTRVAGYPTIVKDQANNDVVVVTDWEWGKWVGDLVVSFDAAGLIASVGSATIVRPVWADGIAKDPVTNNPRALITGEGAEITPDTTFQGRIDTVYKPPIVTLQNTKIGTSTVALDGERPNVRTRETNLGNLIADAMRSRILASNSNPNNYPVVTIINGGGIRASIPAGDVTVGKVLTTLPFGNTLAIVVVTGAQLKAALENGVSQVASAAGRFPQVAGLRFSYDRNGQAASPPTSANGAIPAQPARKGARVTKVEVLEGTAYVAVDITNVTKKYLVVTNNFMLTGGDGYTAFTRTGDTADPSVGGATGQLDTGLVMADVVQDAITAGSPVNPTVSGRITAIYRAWLNFVGNRVPAVAVAGD